MKKQLLLIVMLLSAVACASAVEVEIDGLWYDVNPETKKAEVIKYKNEVFYNGDIVIPETVLYEAATYSVTSVGDGAFSWCSALTSITIPNNVTRLGDMAFFSCYGLTSITIPNSVTTIGACAFYECYGLTSITIPNSVTSIGEWAFSLCSCLTSVIIPSGVTSIGDGAFSGCSGLTTVTVEIENPLPISSYVFSDCANATLYVPYGCKTTYEVADYWKDFKEIVEMQPTTNVALSISDAGIGTYCSEFDLDFTNSEVKAYIVSAFTPSTGKVLLTRIYDVPANTGIVVKGDEGDFQIPTKSAETLVANMLVGVTEDTQLDKVVGDYTNYILAKKAGEVGFYAVADGSTLKANKAYLPLLTASLPASSRVAVVFDDEDAEGNTTYINEAELQNSIIPNVIYNLNGQRLSGLQKGLNVVNGKKVIIK